MKTTFLTALSFVFLSAAPLLAQVEDGRYIEVTGTSEVEIVPDEIHYIIDVKEYFEEEFAGKTKPEDFKTKVPLTRIENNLRAVLQKAGISERAIRVQEVGDYWRESGRDFLVTKSFDITLNDFKQIDDIVKGMDMKGVRAMRIGKLENKDMQTYRQKGKIEALKAAKNKATYLAEALGKRLGSVIRIIEPQEGGGFSPYFNAQSNVSSSTAESFDSFRTIKQNYSMTARFEILDGADGK